MKTAHLIEHGNSFVASDDDDFHLFFRTGVAQDDECILRIKDNDLHATHESLQIQCLGNVALKRLGMILRSNTNLQSLLLMGNQRHVAGEFWPFVGLQENRSLRELSVNFISLGGTAKMRAMAPFLSGNPRLMKLTLRHCFLGQADVDFLSDQLMCRTADTLQELDLSNNFMGNINLDRLAAAVIKHRSVTRLNLAANGIGRRGVASLVKLLRGGSGLEELDLSNNHGIDARDASDLIDALFGSSKLKTLNLKHNYRIQGDEGGWALILPRLLKLVCDTSSISSVINSNHTLSSLGEPHGPFTFNRGFEEEYANPDAAAKATGPWHAAKTTGPWQLFHRPMGPMNAYLLQASFGLNFGLGSDALKAQHKIVTLHIHRHLNLGEESSIDTGVMPRVLALVGFYSWEAIYRVLRARPELCCKSRLARELQTARSENRELRLQIESLKLALKREVRSSQSL